MGIYKFISTLIKHDIIRITGITPNPLCDRFYIDFNSVICIVTTNLERELNHLLYEILLHSFVPVPESPLSPPSPTPPAPPTPDPDLPTTLQSFNERFTPEFIATLTLKRITTFIIDLLKKVPNITHLFISIDGIPPLAKLAEIRRRKLQTFNNQIHYNDLHAELQATLPDIRQTYEQHRICLTKQPNILSIITNHLGSPMFHNILLEVAPNLINYIVSPKTESGEGEKKIINRLFGCNQANLNHVIFSPDSDTIILSLIALNKLPSPTTITIISHDIQISINDLKHNLYNHLTKGMGPYLKYKLQKHLCPTQTTNDLALIFTLFGNDFLPPIPSLSITNDLTTIFFAYTKAVLVSKYEYKSNSPLENHSSNYHIIHNNNTLNHKNLHTFIQILAETEDELIRENYLRQTYKNYHFLKQQFGDTPLYTNICHYIHHANTLFNALRQYYHPNHPNHPNHHNHHRPNLLSILTKNGLISNITFIQDYLCIEHNYVRNNLPKTNRELITHFLNHLHEINEFPLKGKLKLLPKYFSPEYQEEQLQQNKIHPLFQITDLDRAIYLSTHQNKPKSQKTTIYVKTKTKGSPQFHGNYVLCDHLDIPNTHHCAHDYIQGLSWILNYYFNFHQHNHILTWIYPHPTGPLLKDLEFALRDSPPNYPIQTGILTDEERYIYISPTQKLLTSQNNLSPQILATIKENQHVLDAPNLTYEIFRQIFPLPP